MSIHKHVVLRQPRFYVTHDKHKTWTLHVTHVTEEDRGHYMCQVNTEKMISQTGYLQVLGMYYLVISNMNLINLTRFRWFSGFGASSLS